MRRKDTDRLRRRYTRIVKQPDGFAAFVQIEHQGFCVVEGTSRRRANWFRSQVSIALARLVQLEGKKP